MQLYILLGACNTPLYSVLLIDILCCAQALFAKYLSLLKIDNASNDVSPFVSGMTVFLTCGECVVRQLRTHISVQILHTLIIALCFACNFIRWEVLYSLLRG